MFGKGVDVRVSSYDKFIMERCEEIITNDEECCRINNEILKIEKELIPCLPPVLKNKVLEIDELSFKLVNRISLIFADKFTTNR
jgi:hypothetical protein